MKNTGNYVRFYDLSPRPKRYTFIFMEAARLKNVHPRNIDLVASCAAAAWPLNGSPPCRPSMTLHFLIPNWVFLKKLRVKGFPIFQYKGLIYALENVTSHGRARHAAHALGLPVLPI